MLNQQFQKVNQLVIHPIVRTTAIKNAKTPRNYKIRAFLENWKMDYFASPIPDRSKPQRLICYEVLSENKKSSVKRHYLSKQATSIEKKLPINSEERKKIETQELKLKQQRMSLKCSMTESQCITFQHLPVIKLQCKSQNIKNLCLKENS